MNPAPSVTERFLHIGFAASISSKHGISIFPGIACRDIFIFYRQRLHHQAALSRLTLYPFKAQCYTIQLHFRNHIPKRSLSCQPKRNVSSLPKTCIPCNNCLMRAFRPTADTSSTACNVWIARPRRNTATCGSSRPEAVSRASSPMGINPIHLRAGRRMERPWRFSPAETAAASLRKFISSHSMAVRRGS